jgi:hypothetical protein
MGERLLTNKRFIDALLKTALLPMPSHQRHHQ